MILFLPIRTVYKKYIKLSQAGWAGKKTRSSFVQKYTAIFLNRLLVSFVYVVLTDNDDVQKKKRNKYIHEKLPVPRRKRRVVLPKRRLKFN